jgi:hypothetical protein
MGAGSLVLLGTTDALASASRGRGKRLAIVPAGFSWANSTDQVACQSHWSGWQASSPHTLPSPGAVGGVCSAACTRQGTLQLMRQTGLWDAYAQALAAASYGQLALSADVAVLPEQYIPYDSPAPDNFQYYETPARNVRPVIRGCTPLAAAAARPPSTPPSPLPPPPRPPLPSRPCCLRPPPVQALAAAGVAPWMYLVLAPLAQHRVPPFRAWSGGRSSGVRPCGLLLLLLLLMLMLMLMLMLWLLLAPLRGRLGRSRCRLPLLRRFPIAGGGGDAVRALLLLRRARDG